MAKMLDSIGQLTPDDLRISIALGHHPGWESFRKFGMNPDVDTGTEEVWAAGGIRVLPSAAAVASVVSDDVNDTAAGTGARTVVVNGLDEDYHDVTETVTLNGTSPVQTTQTFIRINRTFCSTAGSSSQNAGNISTSIGGDLQSYIEATEGQCHCCNYTVPADHTLLITYYSHTTGRQASTTDIHFLGQLKVFGADPVWRSISDVYNFQIQYANDATVVALPAKSDLRVLAVSNANNNVVSAIIGGFLVHNDYY